MGASSDVAAEQVSYTFSLVQSDDHPVESALEPADLERSSHRPRCRNGPRSTSAMASTTSLIGSEIDLDVRIIVGDPQKHRGERHHQYRDPHRRGSWEWPAIRAHHDQRHDDPARQRAKQPQHDQARQHPGRGDETLGRVCGGGEDRANDFMVSRRPIPDAQIRPVRHRERSPRRCRSTVDVEQDGERAADHPVPARSADWRASSLVNARAEIVRFEARDEPAQRRRMFQAPPTATAIVPTATRTADGRCLLWLN